MHYFTDEDIFSIFRGVWARFPRSLLPLNFICQRFFNLFKELFIRNIKDLCHIDFIEDQAPMEKVYKYV